MNNKEMFEKYQETREDVNALERGLVLFGVLVFSLVVLVAVL